MIAAFGITKSGFFDHFRDKSELAKALLQRYLDREEALFDELFARARELHDDPLHAFLIGLKLPAETMPDLPRAIPAAWWRRTVCYQENMFDRDVRALNREGVLRWRARFRGYLEEIAGRNPPRIEVDLDDLADMFSSLADGGIILSKVLRNKQLLPNQLLLYRSFLRSVFLGTESH